MSQLGTIGSISWVSSTNNNYCYARFFSDNGSSFSHKYTSPSNLTTMVRFISQDGSYYAYVSFSTTYFVTIYTYNTILVSNLSTGIPYSGPNSNVIKYVLKWFKNGRTDYLHFIYLNSTTLVFQYTGSSFELIDTININLTSKAVVWAHGYFYVSANTT